MSWFLLCLTKYADFKGRARRKEYWFYILFLELILVGLVIITTIASTGSETAGAVLGGIIVLLSLGAIVPSISVAVRRLHDSDRSGGWIFITFVPLVGGFIFLYFMVIQGTTGSNQYGEDPLES